MITGTAKILPNLCMQLGQISKQEYAEITQWTSLCILCVRIKTSFFFVFLDWKFGDRRGSRQIEETVFRNGQRSFHGCWQFQCYMLDTILYFSELKSQRNECWTALFQRFDIFQRWFRKCEEYQRWSPLFQSCSALIFWIRAVQNWKI